MAYYSVQKLKDGLWYILVPAPGPALSGPRGRNWVIPPCNQNLGGPWSTKQAAQKIVQQFKLEDLPKVGWSSC